ncbi:uncharacterized protein BXZ73DRAFT_75309 [Epithele typhae]|uniref:uncharacterized protein n=1 Tax=Epithele typhae TaxID=378194 RepID=UPI002008C3E3|nr:uncharacterized protein BXZ73DRAFT_75309 [Epithele typhae]KAH9940762.1 hypothetical protein BXZ73DRAFT_75309 [Epithele typhae]
MVKLTSRFAFLTGAVTSLAAVSVLPTPADAAVIKVNNPNGMPLGSLNTRHPADATVININNPNGTPLGSLNIRRSTPKDVSDVAAEDPPRSQSKAVKKSKTRGASAAKQREHQPMVPLPASLVAKNRKTRGKGKGGKGKKRKGGSGRARESATRSQEKVFVQRNWSLDPITRMKNLWMSTRRASMRELSVDTPDHGDGQQSEFIRRSSNLARLRREPHRHHDDVVVKGHDNRIIFDDDRHGHHDPIVFKGDHEHVHFRRTPFPSPHSRHHHHHHHGDHDDDGEVTVKGSHNDVDVHRRDEVLRPSFLISGSNGHSFVVDGLPALATANPKTLIGEGIKLPKRAGDSGVPGTIEIIRTQSGGDGTGTRVASLVVASNKTGDSGEGGNSSSTTTPTSFVLHASDKDRTQMNLVIIPDSQSSGHWNSTEGSMHSGNDSTSASPTTHADATPTTSPDFMGASALSTNPSDPASFIKVLLQMPVFDDESAELKAFCATFDPSPSTPSAMTVEPCMDDPTGTRGAHKSQIFAFEPESHVIRPLLLDGDTPEDDSAPNANGDAQAQQTSSSKDPADPEGDDTSDDNEAAPSSQDGPMDDEDPSSMDENIGASSFRDEMLDGMSEKTPMDSAAMDNDNDDARPVMLVFTPVAPEVSNVSAPSSSSVLPGALPGAVAGSSSTPRSTPTATKSGSRSPSLATASNSAPSNSGTPSPTTPPSGSSSFGDGSMPKDLDVKVFNPDSATEQRAAMARLGAESAPPGLAIIPVPSTSSSVPASTPTPTPTQSPSPSPTESSSDTASPMPQPSLEVFVADPSPRSRKARRMIKRPCWGHITTFFPIIIIRIGGGHRVCLPIPILEGESSECELL